MKKAIAAVLLAALILSGCGKKSVSGSDESRGSAAVTETSLPSGSEAESSEADSPKVKSEKSEAGSAESPKSGSVKEESRKADKDSGKETASSAESETTEERSTAYEEAIRARAEELKAEGQRVTSLCIADFDGDGTHEGFAFIGNDDADEIGGETGDIWYVREDGAELFEPGQYSAEQKIREFSGRPFYVYDRVFVTGRLDYVCTVQGGKPVSTPVSGLGYVGEADGNGNFTITPAGDYDCMYDPEIQGYIGHSWKPYWFYYRNGVFHEYGGLKIHEEDLKAISGGEEALKSIKDYCINDIFYRGNGLITVNYDDSPMSQDGSCNNRYLLLEYRGGVISVVEDETGEGRDGIYLDSISDIAVYPAGFGKK